MDQIDVDWFSQRVVVIAGILFLGLTIAAIVQTFPLPLPALLMNIISETIRITAFVTAILYVIKEGTN